MRGTDAKYGDYIGWRKVRVAMHDGRRFSYYDEMGAINELPIRPDKVKRLMYQALSGEDVVRFHAWRKWKGHI